MTFEDNEENMSQRKSGSTMEVGSSLSQTLRLAKDQGRITCGVYESGKLLETDPDRVMLCILADNTSTDVTDHIHSTLIEAFCWENEIRLLKVDSSHKVAKILGDLSVPAVNDNDAVTGRATSCRPAVLTTDYTCILVEYPETYSPAEEHILAFHKVTWDAVPQPVLPLQV